MFLPQLSVFMENTPGALQQAIDIMASEKINIRAVTLADTKDFGILRLIVDQPDKAHDILKSHQFATVVNEVMAVEIPDRPGGLAGLINTLSADGINIEYMYGFLEKNSDNAIIVIRVENLQNAVNILLKNQYRILTKENLSTI